MDAAAEVARIKADRAALVARWEAVVRTRLEQGPAMSCELGKLAGASSSSGFWNWLRLQQQFAVALRKEAGPSGHENIVWGIRS